VGGGHRGWVGASIYLLSNSIVAARPGARSITWSGRRSDLFNSSSERADDLGVHRIGGPSPHNVGLI
jgi:hypothetical protein